MNTNGSAKVVFPPPLNFSEDMIGDIVLRTFDQDGNPKVETGKYIKTGEMIMGYPVYVWQKDD